MIGGKILLEREKVSYVGGFCMIKKCVSDNDVIQLLHKEEIKYYTCLERIERKISYALGRISAKEAVLKIVKLSEQNSVWIARGVFNNPVVKGVLIDNVQVSISHCDNIAVSLAFPEEHPLGVDIEKIDEKNLKSFMSQINNFEIELRLKYNLSLLSMATLIWTAKEGLSKVLKIGLTVDFQMLSIETLNFNNNVFEGTFKYYSQYKFNSLIFENYICTIVMPLKTTVDLNIFHKSFVTLLR